MVRVVQLSSSSNFDSSDVALVAVVVLRHCYQLFNGLHLRQRHSTPLLDIGHCSVVNGGKTDTERKTTKKTKEERFLNVFD